MTDEIIPDLIIALGIVSRIETERPLDGAVRFRAGAYPNDFGDVFVEVEVEYMISGRRWLHADLYPLPLARQLGAVAICRELEETAAEPRRRAIAEAGVLEAAKAGSEVH